MNLLNKKIWVFIGIFLALVVFPIEKSFASTSSIIKVNGIEVDITRDLGEEEETYTIVTNDILKSFSLFFDENNKVIFSLGDVYPSYAPNDGYIIFNAIVTNNP